MRRAVVVVAAVIAVGTGAVLVYAASDDDGTPRPLDAAADELNDRPRKRLSFAKPTEKIAELLLH